MALKFAPGWDEAKAGYAGNQAYLDLFTEEQVSAALWRADGRTDDLQQLVNAAFRLDRETVTIEQGPHQPQNVADGGGTLGGFSLHVTPRWRGTAWHLYLIQNSSGSLDIEDWSGAPPRKKFKKTKQYYFGSGLAK